MLKDHSNDTSPRYVVAVSDKSLMPSWWIEYNDGWCEQGGASNSSRIQFLKSFKDAKYTVLRTNGNGRSATIANEIYTSVFTRYPDYIEFGSESAIMPLFWQASGYIR